MISSDTSHPPSRAILRALFHDEEGFSMTELMVVLVIIGTLTLLALPRFMSVATRAKMSEAKMMLRQVHALQKSYYMEHDVYASTLEALQFEQVPLVTDGGTARYQIAVEEARDSAFVATATSVVDFDKDGTMNVWKVDQGGVIEESTPD